MSSWKNVGNVISPSGVSIANVFVCVYCTARCVYHLKPGMTIDHCIDYHLQSLSVITADGLRVLEAKNKRMEVYNARPS